MSYARALIVDVSKIARVTLKKKLEQRGLETVLAEDAQQALSCKRSFAVYCNSHINDRVPFGTGQCNLAGCYQQTTHYNYGQLVYLCLHTALL